MLRARRGRSPAVRRLRLEARPGFAMFMALGTLVIIAVLIAASTFITLQETRLGQNSIVSSRAFTIAEYGLNKIQADWDKTPNLNMANGASFDTSYNIAGQGICRVRYTRLNNETFWIVSEGRASAGNATNAARTSVKRVGAILRLRIPTIRANGAITTAGDITTGGSSLVSGYNTLPTGWTGCDVTAPDKAGIVAGPTANIDIRKSSGVVGNPQLERDPLAADSNTYVRYGDETWNALASQANFTLPGGNIPDAEPTTNADGSCNKTNPRNWGEPWRGPGTVPACEKFFPIIYITGTAHLQNGRGQGIMLVEGDVQFEGQFEWYGLIVARDDILKGNGNANIYGAVMSRNATLTDPMSTILGNISINYSQCSLEHAMRGSAQVVQAKQRAWTEMY
ncbi:MAG TPA: pilus assembly PilX N-terminal domain-containing protein [Gemmatimonadaceae bacterium]|nr:pilus assembly PilX N-terminal domain-containing protein [Gemmatimonadaceae bacterium]